MNRINIKEVKRHPWVLHEIVKKLSWLDNTNPFVQSQGRKIEVFQEKRQEDKPENASTS